MTTTFIAVVMLAAVVVLIYSFVNVNHLRIADLRHRKGEYQQDVPLANTPLKTLSNLFDDVAGV